MAGLPDYIKWRGDLSFEASPFNEIDAFLFTQIAMIDFQRIIPENDEGISFHDAADAYFAHHSTSVRNLGLLQSKQLLPTFKLMMNTTRYQGVRLAHYVNKISRNNSEQFSAVSFRLPGELCAVCYRGTDDTIVGWKENCDLAVKQRIPAQVDALRYLCRAGETEQGKIIVCGHSKGGNLAVTAFLDAPGELAERIRRVYDFDGPGFPEEALQGERYEQRKSRIVTYVSQNSLIGLLFHRPGKVRIVRSIVAGLAAHDGFTWEVLGPHFVRTRQLSAISAQFDRLVNAKIDALSIEEREAYIRKIFRVLYRSGAETLTDLLRPDSLMELFLSEPAEAKRKRIRMTKKEEKKDREPG